MTLSEELDWRGFVNQTTLRDHSLLDTQQLTFYWGVDPSSNSMTVGNLAMAMMVCHFINHGHKAVLLVGGATGMIGDPDGKNEERELKSLETVAKNKAGIAAEYRRIFADNAFTLVDNYDWFKDIGYLQFLRDIGKYFSMTQLLDREFVQSRIGKGGKGISYAEFSYSLIQGYDFLHLFRTQGVTLQLAGADQWGNSLSGVELIRKLEGKEAHVWTGPLIVDSTTGKKFGKSETGAIWLDPDKTTPFDFYQFWLNTDDVGAQMYLKIYTLLSKDEIESILANFTQNPAERAAQKTLAYEVTKLVHGEEQANAVRGAVEALARGENADAISKLTTKMGEVSVIELLVRSGLAPSNTQAQKLLKQGGVKLNKQKVTSEQIIVKEDDVLQAGKRSFVRLVKWRK